MSNELEALRARPSGPHVAPVLARFQIGKFAVPPRRDLTLELPRRANADPRDVPFPYLRTYGVRTSNTEARKDFKDVLDAVESGRPVGVECRSRRTALVDADGLRSALAHSRDLPQPVAAAEAGGWTMLIPGAPVAVDGDSFEDATDELVLALREYAEDWVDRLHAVPNHALHWALIQFVALSSDSQLASWIRGDVE